MDKIEWTGNGNRYELSLVKVVLLSRTVLTRECFSWNGVGSLVQIEGITNADKYIEIIVLKMGPEEE